MKHKSYPRCHGNVGYSGECIDRNPTEKMEMKPVYLIVGIPGSGKSWVCEQAPFPDFYHVPHDEYPKPEAYLAEIFLQLKVDLNRSLLIETPFSVSKIMEPLQSKGFQVIPVFIIEAPEVVTERYMQRFENKTTEDIVKAMKQLKTNLARQDTYKKRAQELKAFSGTSAEVLDYLKKVVA